MKRNVPEEELLPLNFSKGVNNIDDEESLADGFARTAKDVDIDRAGFPRRRKGYTRRLDLTNGHSLYSNGIVNLVADSGYLNLLNTEDMSLSQIIRIQKDVSYDDFLGTVYFTDGDIFGRIHSDGSYSEAWISNPNGNPTLVDSATGSLQPGKYLLSITNIGPTGEESGTDISVPITIDGGGIDMTNIPQNPDATHTRIYLTSAGGAVLYRQVDIPMGLTTYALKSFSEGKALTTQFAQPMPAGSVLCNHYGRLYSAINGNVYYSLGLRPGLTRLMDNYFPMMDDSNVLMISTVTEGLYVGTSNAVYFLNGSDPEKMQLRKVYPRGVVKGTVAYMPASILLGSDESVDVQTTEEVPCWFTSNGLVVGVGGSVLPMTEKQLSVDRYEAGASIYREEGGIRSVLTALHSKMGEERLSSTDNISFEVRRNGIIVPA